MTTLAISPKTPCDMFAALALSPTCGTGQPTGLPSLNPAPPTPSDMSLSPAYTTEPTRPAGPIHRPLASNEAKQLSLLLAQHLFPVRGSQKGLMSESIALAESLHEAGIRWDTKRRVMGTHLRGIWEEGQRLGNAKSLGGHGPMDLYVQGSFLSIAEPPHPLDPMPIPIEIHPASFTHLPKLTLQAGLATSLPCLLPDPVARPLLSPSSNITNDQMTGVLEAEMQRAIHVGAATGLGRVVTEKSKRRWRERKKAGLKIRVDHLCLDMVETSGCTESRPAKQWKSLSTPRTAATLLLSARRSSFAGILPRNSKGWFGSVSKGRLIPPLKIGGSNSGLGGTKSARRVSFGGWEVR